MSIRSQRVASSIQRLVQQAIGKGLNDPRIRGLITVTHVNVDDDLRNANIRVSVMPHEHGELTLHGLKAAARHIRHTIADDLVLPQTPHLHFKLDTGAAKQADIFSALAKVRTELEESEVADPQAGEPQPAEQATTSPQHEHLDEQNPPGDAPSRHDHGAEA